MYIYKEDIYTYIYIYIYIHIHTYTVYMFLYTHCVVFSKASAVVIYHLANSTVHFTLLHTLPYTNT